MTAPPREWIVMGERVGLRATTREEFVARYDAMNDATITALNMQPTTRVTGGVTMPPNTPQDREATFDTHVRSGGRIFSVYGLDDESRCIGEAFLFGISWPDASGEYGIIVFDEADRRRGLGTESTLLVIAYAFDGLGLHRVEFRYLDMNPGVSGAVERSATEFGIHKAGALREAVWAFGTWRDVEIYEVLAQDFPPHPATTHLRELRGRVGGPS